MPEQIGESTWGTEAGKLCLDFANTMDWHLSDHPAERLTDYGQLVSWAQAQGLLSPDEGRRLQEKAAHQPRAAEASLQRARQLRDAIYRIFAAMPRGRSIEPDDLRTLNAGLAQAMPQARIELQQGNFAWGWQASDDLEGFLRPVVRSAADLLTSEERARVGQCADDRGCGWLFFDSSRNHSRRWCRMDDCGNRAKARRHYARRRGQAGAARTL